MSTDNIGKLELVKPEVLGVLKAKDCIYLDTIGHDNLVEIRKAIRAKVSDFLNKKLFHGNTNPLYIRTKLLDNKIEPEDIICHVLLMDRSTVGPGKPATVTVRGEFPLMYLETAMLDKKMLPLWRQIANTRWCNDLQFRVDIPGKFDEVAFMEIRFKKKYNRNTISVIVLDDYDIKIEPLEQSECTTRSIMKIIAGRYSMT